MDRRRIFTLAVSLFPLALAAPVIAVEPGATAISSFETPAEMSAVFGRHAAAAQVTDGATDGKAALQITFQTVDWPAALWTAPTGQPWNWSKTPVFAIDIYNPGEQTVTVSFRFDDDPASKFSLDHVLSATDAIAPKAHKTEYIVLDGSAKAPAKATALTTTGKVDAGKIARWQIYLHSPASPTTLIVDNVRALPGA